MKSFYITISVIFFFFTSSVTAQSPELFKYQALVRDSAGNIVINNPVSLKISILAGSESGSVVYSEIQYDTTNQFGLVTLNIGKGIVESGNFTSIAWAENKFFLKLEAKISPDPNYAFMGTSQLLSVPYSLHSKTSEGLLVYTEEQRDTMTIIPIGKSIFNSTSKKINYYEGSHWYEVTGICLPQPTTPNAGFDQINITGATALLSANTPSSGTGSWKIKSGIGGTIEDTLNPVTQFSGLAGNTYTLSWTIKNDCGSLSDIVVLNFAPFACVASFKDVRDNKVYTSVLIGSQCWMAQNINIGTRVEGDVIMSNDGIFEKYCQGNINANCDTYGGLYQWNEMMQYSTTPGAQGICPAGWHIATDAEWKTLEGTVDSQYHVGDPVWDLEGDRGYDAGGKLKEAGYAHWAFPNTGATNSSGFTGLPGGARNTDGTFPSFLISGRFWTSTESGSIAYRHILSTTTMDVARNLATKNYGLSVRCLKN